ncbi:MAG: hypothetical protein DBY45_01880 [Clostridiales bacterium]|nr:MAG: hypothetical protein DBY45_01880 [Clostridiales bacterium]
MNKQKIDVVSTVNQAIRFIKSCPCAICSRGWDCEIKYKGTCKVARELRIRLYGVEEMEALDEI